MSEMNERALKWVALELRQINVDFHPERREDMKGRKYVAWVLERIISGEIAGENAVLMIGFVASTLIQNNDLKPTDFNALITKARAGAGTFVSGEVNHTVDLLSIIG